MGATAVLEIAAETPPIMKSLMKSIVININIFYFILNLYLLSIIYIYPTD